MEPVDKVKRYLAEQGIEIDVVTFETSTRTAEMAAEALNTELGNSVKSLLLLADRKPVLVLCPGSKRVDTGKVARKMGVRKVKMADANTVKELTGYAVGGIPPVAHKQALSILIDRSFLNREAIYAGAGAANAMFRISASELIRVTHGEVIDVTE